MRIKQKRTKSNKKTSVVIFSIVIATLFIGTVYFLHEKYNTFSLKETPATEQPKEERKINDVDYSGPTETDIKESQAGKNNSKPKDEKEKPTSIVNVGISYAGISDGNYEIRAFTPDVIEGSGICTATLKKGSAVISESSQAFIDAKTSQCRPIYIPISELEKGKWSLTVEYKSPIYTGKTDSEEVEI